MALNFETTEDLIKWLTDENDGRAVFSQLTTGYIKSSEIDGLIKSKESILSEKRKLKSDYDQLKQQFEGVDLEELKGYKEQYEKLLLNGKTIDGSNQNLTELKSMYDSRVKNFENDKKKYLAEIETKNKMIESLNNQVNGSIITKNIEGALKEVNVSSPYLSVLLAANKDRAVIETDDSGNKTVMMSTDEGGRISVKDYFKNWAITEDAKNFIKAPGNGGGGSQGSQMPPGRAKELYEALEKATSEFRTQDAVAITNELAALNQNN